MEALRRHYLQVHCQRVQVRKGCEELVELCLKTMAGHSLQENRQAGVAGGGEQEAARGCQMLLEEVKEGEKGLQFRDQGGGHLGGGVQVLAGT